MVENENTKKVLSKLDTQDFIAQLGEESAELSQACCELPKAKALGLLASSVEPCHCKTSLQQ